MRLTFSRYAVVGLSSVTIGTIIFWFLTDIFGMFYLLSGAVVGLMAITYDFVLNETWTFSHRKNNDLIDKNPVNRLGKYAFSKAIGFAIGLLTLAFFTQIVGFYYLLSNVFSIAASFIWNYSMASFWVWAKKIR